MVRADERHREATRRLAMAPVEVARCHAAVGIVLNGIPSARHDVHNQRRLTESAPGSQVEPGHHEHCIDDLIISAIFDFHKGIIVMVRHGKP